MAQQNASNQCPHCGQRLIKTSKNCLHCGKLARPGTSDAAGQGGGSGINFTTILVIGLVVLGGGFFLTLGMCGKTAIDVGQGNVEMEVEGTQTVCMTEDQEDRIADFYDRGWTEIQAEPGQRCFQK